MYDQGYNRLQVLEHEIQTALQHIVTDGGMFYQLRVKVREIALRYPEYIVWLPELHGSHAVIDVWDRAWNRLAEVKVQVSEKMVTAPMW